MQNYFMELKERLEAFVQLGNILYELKNENSKLEANKSEFKKMIELANKGNEWFTLDNLYFSLNSIAENLSNESLEKWISNYPKLKNQNQKKIVALITAGNIPLLGFMIFFQFLLPDMKYLLSFRRRMIN